MNRIGGEVHSTKTFKVPANTAYTFTLDVVKGYVYLGYKLNNGAFTDGVPPVTITSITQDIYLEFMYGVEDPKKPGTELVYHVEESYVDQDGNEISTKTNQDVIALLSYNGNPLTINGYDYVGYRIVSSTSRSVTTKGKDVVAGTPNIASLNEYVRVEFVYNKQGSTNPVKPVRQSNRKLQVQE